MTDIEINPGVTARTGKSKAAARWEVLFVDGDSVHLSKLGGDGYVNKRAKIADLLDVQEQRTSVTLATVIGLRDKVRAAGAAINDRARFMDAAPKLLQDAEDLKALTVALNAAWSNYRASIAEHHPETQEEK